MAFCISFDKKAPELRAGFESSVLSDASKDINKFAKRLKIKNIYEFFSMSAQNELAPPEHREKAIPWFEAQEGIDWLAKVSGFIRKNPSSVKNSEQVLRDLGECSAILSKAKDVGAKWHFWMDI